MAGVDDDVGVMVGVDVGVDVMAGVDDDVGVGVDVGVGLGGKEEHFCSHSDNVEYKIPSQFSSLTKKIGSLVVKVPV
jgi:hypothetical protein